METEFTEAENECQIYLINSKDSSSVSPLASQAHSEYNGENNADKQEVSETEDINQSAIKDEIE